MESQSHKSRRSQRKKLLRQKTWAFVKQPHSIFLLVCAGCMLTYTAFGRREEGQTFENTRSGIFAACALFLFYCLLQMKDSVLLRPHPAFWRVIKGCCILYVLFLVFLFFQTKQDARRVMQFLSPGDPEIGYPIEEMEYGVDCRIYTPEDPESNFRNVRDTVYDEFIIAHVLGHFARMLVLRDIKICLLLSAIFELMEYSLEFMLPNFGECWWDHWIVDLAVCNMIGMVGGYYLCKYFEMKAYDWVGFGEIKTYRGKIKRLFAQFTPYDWEPRRWKVFENYRRFLAMLYIMVMLILFDLSSFFLKRLLYIPNQNYINILRMFMWLAFCAPAIREVYVYMSDPSCHKIGEMAWLGSAGIALEWLIIFKFSSGEFEKPCPPLVFWSWSFFLMISIPWFFYYFWVSLPRKQMKLKENLEEKKKGK